MPCLYPVEAPPILENYKSFKSCPTLTTEKTTLKAAFTLYQIIIKVQDGTWRQVHLFDSFAHPDQRGYKYNCLIPKPVTDKPILDAADQSCCPSHCDGLTA